MSWTWRLDGEDGEPVGAVESLAHSSQSDAENWLGEAWRELAEQGVAQATLLQAGAQVYGPMPLAEL